MKTFNSTVTAGALLACLLAGAAFAAPHAGANRASPEARIAAIPGLTQSQRDDIVRIETESRESQRALMERTRSERQALREGAAQKLRAALGDKAYADYLTWKLEQRGHHRADRRGHRKGQRAPSSTGEDIKPSAE